MSIEKKVYRLDASGQKVYDGTAANDVFVLPPQAVGYRAYIDSLYEASKTLSPTAVTRGVSVVADAMIRDVIDAPDTIQVTGKTYYISNSGSDDNDGLSPQTAWATADKLRAMHDVLEAGDAVLFERGGLWRKRSERVIWDIAPEQWDEMTLFVAKEGVSYGAYGEGAKPILCGSPRNYADPALWTATAHPNVYACTEKFYNPGIVALDHSGELGKYDEKLAMKHVTGRLDFNGIEDLQEDCSYWFDTTEDTLYFCSVSGNPGERFSTIEIGGRCNLIANHNAELIDNFHFLYDGYGVSGGVHLNVTNCIFSYLGGCQANVARNSTNFCGNAVEIYGPCDGLYVRNCWMYQICDTGVTHQLWTDKGACVQQDIAFEGNVIEYCHWAVEFNNPPSSDGNERVIRNYSHSYNVLRMGGYGWGSKLLQRNRGTLYNCFGTAETVDGVCEKNVLDRSDGTLYRMRLPGDHDIQYRDNINIQYEDGWLGLIFNDSEPVPYDDTAEKRIADVAKQSGCIYIYLPNNNFVTE